MTSPIKILFVDDDEIVRMAVKRFATKLDYDFVMAKSVKEAAELLKSQKFDLAVIDHFLVDGTSFDLIKKIKNIPFIILTGGGDEQIAVRAMKEGASDYLIKDINYLNILPVAIKKAIKHKADEDELKSAYKTTRDIIEKSPFGIYVVNEEGFIDYVNPAMVKIAGDYYERFKALNVFDLPTYREIGLSKKIKAGLGGKYFKLEEVEYTSYFGHKTTVRNFTGIPLREKGERKVLMIVEDVTKAKHVDAQLRKAHDVLEKRVEERTAKLESALEELQQSHEEISLLLKGTHAVLEYREFKDTAQAIYNISKNFIGASAGYVSLLATDGIDIGPVFVDSGGLDFTVGPSLPIISVRGLRAEGYKGRKAVCVNDFKNSKWAKHLPDGHTTPYENALFAPIVIGREVVGALGFLNKPGGFTQNDAGIASAFGDITAVALHNSKILKSLENSEERTRLIVDTALDAVITMDGYGKITGWNAQAQAILGWSRSEVIGRRLSSTLIPPKYRKAHEQGIKHFLSTGEGPVFNKRLEITAMHRDGHEFPVELSISPPARVGESFIFSGFVHDITERKRVEQALKARQMEIEKLNAGLEIRVHDQLQKSRQKDLIMMHQSRRAAMGQMIELIAHQWKQPLNAINILLYSIKDCIEDKEMNVKDIQEFIVNGEDLTKKMATTIDDFKNFFKPNKKKKKFVVNSVVKETLSLINASFRYDNISVSVKEGDGQIIVYGFPNEYSQVILNILNNAKDAIVEKKKEGRIRIDIQNKNNNALVKIKDDGGGIPKDIINNIFDSYFTTKEKTKGSGIGLYMSKVIIEDHMDGTIEVRNSKDGVEFTIITPITGS